MLIQKTRLSFTRFFLFLFLSLFYTSSCNVTYLGLGVDQFIDMKVADGIKQTIWVIKRGLDYVEIVTGGKYITQYTGISKANLVMGSNMLNSFLFKCLNIIPQPLIFGLTIMDEIAPSDFFAPKRTDYQKYINMFLRAGVIKEVISMVHDGITAILAGIFLINRSSKWKSDKEGDFFPFDVMFSKFVSCKSSDVIAITNYFNAKDLTDPEIEFRDLQTIKAFLCDSKDATVNFLNFIILSTNWEQRLLFKFTGTFPSLIMTNFSDKVEKRMREANIKENFLRNFFLDLMLSKMFFSIFLDNITNSLLIKKQLIYAIQETMRKLNTTVFVSFKRDSKGSDGFRVLIASKKVEKGLVSLLQQWYSEMLKTGNVPRDAIMFVGSSGSGKSIFIRTIRHYIYTLLSENKTRTATFEGMIPFLHSFPDSVTFSAMVLQSLTQALKTSDIIIIEEIEEMLKSRSLNISSFDYLMISTFLSSVNNGRQRTPGSYGGLIICSLLKPNTDPAIVRRINQVFCLDTTSESSSIRRRQLIIKTIVFKYLYNNENNFITSEVVNNILPKILYHFQDVPMGALENKVDFFMTKCYHFCQTKAKSSFYNSGRKIYSGVPFISYNKAFKILKNIN